MVVPSCEVVITVPKYAVLKALRTFPYFSENQSDAANSSALNSFVIAVRAVLCSSSDIPLSGSLSAGSYELLPISSIAYSDVMSSAQLDSGKNSVKNTIKSFVLFIIIIFLVVYLDCFMTRILWCEIFRLQKYRFSFIQYIKIVSFNPKKRSTQCFLCNKFNKNTKQPNK